ncbi:MAG TPA: pyrimidine-nucleoside phosphorylase [Firmicutes bacterium]|nr:pyrimidine-nucleoside phosphorylase [Bacillota bacterium]
MRASDLILKKRRGGELTREEINFLVSGYVSGSIPDYQMAAFAMAVYFRGMTGQETLNLTLAMKESGDTVSLHDIPGIKVDKHSTGGVGDTTTLVIAPLVAAAGVPVAKMTGRGLGHTGGTLDKLESIPGFNTNLSIAEMIRAVREHGVAVVGQTGNLVPADKKLYALRDVTATVDSLPLIASSIMSKKMAAGADALVLDVKTGDGAFLKDLEEAFELARTMVEIGTGAGRETVAVITGMDQPLGKAIGNALEVEEAILTLQRKGPADLEELCLVLGGYMLHLARKVSGPEEGREKLKQILDGGAGLQKFKELILSQQGDPKVVDDLSFLPRAEVRVPVKAAAGGYVHSIKAEAIGRAAVGLGAGRETKESAVDPAAGIILYRKVGHRVSRGEVLAVMHTSAPPGTPELEAAGRMIREAFVIKSEPAEKTPLILGYVDRCGGKRY